MRVPVMPDNPPLSGNLALTVFFLMTLGPGSYSLKSLFMDAFMYIRWYMRAPG